MSHTDQTRARERSIEGPSTPWQRTAIWTEADRILADASFKKSRRCVVLFRRLIEPALEGGDEGGIKERASSETVEVRSDTVPALQADSATIQDVVSETSVQNLPLNGRNFVGLVQITAGVNQGLTNSIASGNRPDDRRPTSSFSANGQPDTLNNNMIDGLDNNEREQGFIGVRPSIDGISEVRVMTNDYTAEVGRSTGAVVNVLTKGGSNEFHGTLFEYVRNDKFDARDYFATTGDKPEFRQNDFGGSLGGPVMKNKTFFFGDVEWNRLIAGTTYVTTVPTADELNHPTTLPGFPSGVPINDVALRYFNMYPAANLPGSINNFEAAPTNPSSPPLWMRASITTSAPRIRYLRKIQTAVPGGDV